MDFKYKIADVAKEFGMPAKKVVETVSGVTGEAYKTAGTFEEKELNVLLETLTRENAEDSLDAYLASGKEPAPAPKAEKKPEPKKAEAPKPAAQPAQGSAPAANAAPAAQSADKAAKPQQEQRKRERRVVDTSAVTVNADRFDDRVDSLISERAFGAYLKYARLIAEQGIAELEAGSIVPSPFEDACAVCPYGGICGFEAGVNGEAREVNNVTSAVILAAAGEEEEDSASERGTETGD